MENRTVYEELLFTTFVSIWQTIKEKSPLLNYLCGYFYKQFFILNIFPSTSKLIEKQNMPNIFIQFRLYLVRPVDSTICKTFE